MDQPQDTGFFLGMLRSGLDDADGLPAPWSNVPRLVEQVVSARAAGRLSDVTAWETLAQVRVMQSDGTVWTVGAQSARWYRRVGDGVWVPASPPPTVDDPSVHASVSAAAAAVALALAGD